MNVALCFQTSRFVLHLKGNDVAEHRELYGVIIAMKGTFGFIQAIQSEEQIYFGEKEICEGMKVGDKVGYLVQQSQSQGGSAVSTRACKVRCIASGIEKVTTSNLRGTIVTAADRSRSNMGVIEVVAECIMPASGVPRIISFQTDDVIQSALTKSRRLERGDLVEFSVVKHSNSHLYVASEVCLKSSRKDWSAAGE